MKMRLLTVGRLADKNYNQLFYTYLDRIRRYVNIDHIVVKPDRIGKQAATEILKEEGTRILAKIPPKSYLIALDKEGQSLSSEGFASFLQNAFNKSQRQIIFVIGGPLGLSNDVLNRADIKLSLSQMTFAHELAAVMLSEQIYRGLCILHGGKYHK